MTIQLVKTERKEIKQNRGFLLFKKMHPLFGKAAGSTESIIGGGIEVHRDKKPGLDCRFSTKPCNGGRSQSVGHILEIIG